LTFCTCDFITDRLSKIFWSIPVEEKLVTPGLLHW